MDTITGFEKEKDWAILRNVVKANYVKIRKIYAKYIYQSNKNKFEGIYSEDQIKRIQHNETKEVLKTVNQAIVKKFYNTNEYNFKAKTKWQDRLSCDELTRLILLQIKAVDFSAINKVDYERAGYYIKSLNKEDFLFSSREGIKDFKNVKYKQSEIENKENIRTVLTAYIKKAYKEFKNESTLNPKPLQSYIDMTMDFVSNNKFNLQTAFKKPVEKIVEKTVEKSIEQPKTIAEISNIESRVLAEKLIQTLVDKSKTKAHELVLQCLDENKAEGLKDLTLKQLQDFVSKISNKENKKGRIEESMYNYYKKNLEKNQKPKKIYIDRFTEAMERVDRRNEDTAKLYFKKLKEQEEQEEKEKVLLTEKEQEEYALFANEDGVVKDKSIIECILKNRELTKKQNNKNKEEENTLNQ